MGVDSAEDKTAECALDTIYDIFVKGGIMRDWVVPYLKESGEPFSIFSEPYFEKIEKVNFDCLEANKDMLSTFHIISNKLMENLNHDFGSAHGDRQRQVHFTINFGAVLADLSKDNFDKLCAKTNVFYRYRPSKTVEHTDAPELKEDLQIDKEDQLQVVIFTHDFPASRRLLIRQIIVHELIRIIEGLDDSDSDVRRAHEIAREWGFEAEEDAALQYHLRE